MERLAPRRRLWLAAGVTLAVAAAFAIGARGVPEGFEPQLVLLIRFMAVIKLAGAIAVAAVVGWRFGQAPGLRRTAGYSAAAMIMAAGPALMWDMHFIVLGSVLFYAGLGAIVLLARAQGASRAAKRLLASARSETATAQRLK